MAATKPCHTRSRGHISGSNSCTGPKANSAILAAALWAFLRYGRRPEQCLIRAVGFGGDTDTIAAMAGALVGALLAASWIPARWYDNIENGQHGRDVIGSLARRLAAPA